MSAAGEVLSLIFGFHLNSRLGPARPAIKDFFLGKRIWLNSPTAQ
jgi:hypothetical protein